MEKIYRGYFGIRKPGCLKDWLVEVSEESDIDSDVITARSLLSQSGKLQKAFYYLYQTTRTGTAGSYDYFLCGRVYGVPGHGGIP
mgnify:CR=1 FL=1